MCALVCASSYPRRITCAVLVKDAHARTGGTTPCHSHLRGVLQVLQPLGQLQGPRPTGNGQDGLDLGIRQETSSSVECRETGCKTRRSSGTSAAAGERARVVEEPHRVQSQVSAVGQVADRQSSAVSSNGDVGSSQRARPLQSSGVGCVRVCVLLYLNTS